MGNCFLARMKRAAAGVLSVALLTAGAISLSSLLAYGAESACSPTDPIYDPSEYDVKLDIVKPDVIDITKDLVFKLHGTGYKAEGPSVNGVYILVDPSTKWELNRCFTLTGNDALYANWIQSSMINDGVFDLDFKIPAGTLEPGKTYTLGAVGAHQHALVSRGFDRGIKFTTPEAEKGLTPAKNVKATVNDDKDVTVTWDFDGNPTGYRFRVMIECVDQCTSVKKWRTMDKPLATDRSHTFVESDNGIWVPSVQAVKNDEWEKAEAVKGPRFGVGVEVPEQPNPSPQSPDKNTDETTNVAAGSISWGLKESFTQYVEGKIARGEITPKGVTWKDRVFGFKASGGQYDDEAKQGTINYTGSVQFTGHRQGPQDSPLLDMTISNPQLEITGKTGKVFLEVSSKELGGDQKIVDYGKVHFANIDFDKVAVQDGKLSFNTKAVRLTADGAKAFAGFYGKDQELDPISGVADLGKAKPIDKPDTGDPQVTVPKDPDPKQPGPKPDTGDPQVTVPKDPDPKQPGPKPNNPGEQNKPNKPTPTKPAPKKCEVDPSRMRVTSGELGWGLRGSFTSYVEGSIAKGKITPQGVTFKNRVFGFNAKGGLFNTATKQGTIYFGGSVHFTGHKGILDMTISNPELQINNGSGTLYLNVKSSAMDGKRTSYGRVPFANVSLSNVDVNGGRLTFASKSVTLTAQGAKAFAGFYSEGETLDGLTGSVSLVPATECDPDGNLITYDPFGSVSDGGSNGGKLAWTGASIGLQLLLATMLFALSGLALARRYM